jgi:hypothetical protein
MTTDSLFVVRDHRTPGEPLLTLPLKMPAEAMVDLELLAGQLRCSRGALGRALLVEALQKHRTRAA